MRQRECEASFRRYVDSLPGSRNLGDCAYSGTGKCSNGCGTASAGQPSNRGSECGSASDSLSRLGTTRVARSGDSSGGHIIAVAVNSEGLDYDSKDGFPSDVSRCLIVDQSKRNIRTPRAY